MMESALTKTELRLIRIFFNKGMIGYKHMRIDTICARLGLSRTPTRKTLDSLEKKDIVKKIRRNRTLYYSLSSNAMTSRLVDTLIAHPTRSYEEVITGTPMKLLTAALNEPKTVPELSKITHLNGKVIYRYLPKLRQRGFISKVGNTYFSGNTWPELKEYLKSFRTDQPEPRKILWSSLNRNEYVYLSLAKEEQDSTLTGFSAYPSYGIQIGITKNCFHYPKGSLNPSTVFIHSMLQIDDTRKLGLAIVFFLKNRLMIRRLSSLANKYDCKRKLEDFQRIMKSKDNIVITESFGKKSKKELNEIVKLYTKELKNVFKRRTSKSE